MTTNNTITPATLLLSDFKAMPLEQKLETIYARLLTISEEGRKQPRPQGYSLKDVAGMLHVSYPSVYKWAQLEGLVIAHRNTRMSWQQIKELAKKYNKVIDEAYL